MSFLFSFRCQKFSVFNFFSAVFLTFLSSKSWLFSSWRTVKISQTFGFFCLFGASTFSATGTLSGSFSRDFQVHCDTNSFWLFAKSFNFFCDGCTLRLQIRYLFYTFGFRLLSGDGNSIGCFKFHPSNIRNP